MNDATADRIARRARLARQLRDLGATVEYWRSRFVVTYNGKTCRHRYLAMAARKAGVGC
jgi:hypothetical protein